MNGTLNPDQMMLYMYGLNLMGAQPFDELTEDDYILMMVAHQAGKEHDAKVLFKGLSTMVDSMFGGGN